MIADRDQAEPAADLPVADPPQAADPLAATVAELLRENAALRAKVALLETPPRTWLVRKNCARHEGIRYETLRKRCKRGSVVAQRDGGRILVDLYSLQDYLARSRDL
jgi:hypothetical protein